MDCPHEQTGLRANGPHIERFCKVCEAHLGFVRQTIDHGKAAHYALPFGKYKGQCIKSVPLDYLLWAKDNLKEGSVKRHIQAFLKGSANA